MIKWISVLHSTEPHGMILFSKVFTLWFPLWMNHFQQIAWISLANPSCEIVGHFSFNADRCQHVFLFSIPSVTKEIFVLESKNRINHQRGKTPVKNESASIQ